VTVTVHEDLLLPSSAVLDVDHWPEFRS